MRMSKVEAAASTLRSELGFQGGAVNEKELRKVLERKGYFLFYYPFGNDSFSGAALQDHNVKVIVINSSHTLGRQNFTLCHELAHFHLHNIKNHIDGITPINKEKEKEADYFASCFLMPHDEVIKFVEDNNSKKLDLITAMKVSAFFRVSFQAAVIRLAQILHIKKIPEDLLNASPVKAARLLDLSPELYESNNEIYWSSTSYILLAYEALQKGKISTGKFLKMMEKIGHDGYEVLDNLKGRD